MRKKTQSYLGRRRVGITKLRVRWHNDGHVLLHNLAPVTDCHWAALSLSLCSKNRLSRLRVRVSVLCRRRHLGASSRPHLLQALGSIVNTSRNSRFKCFARDKSGAARRMGWRAKNRHREKRATAPKLQESFGPLLTQGTPVCNWHRSTHTTSFSLSFRRKPLRVPLWWQNCTTGFPYRARPTRSRARPPIAERHPPHVGRHPTALENLQLATTLVSRCADR